MTDKKVLTEEEAMKSRCGWGETLWELQNLTTDSTVADFEKIFREAPMLNEQGISKHIHAMANVFYGENVGHALLAYLAQQVSVNGVRQNILLQESNELGRFFAGQMSAKPKEPWEDDHNE